ncbi:MAG: DUF4192 family protein, partial [Candidatus Nanopelagicaceae bacterium]|nr:DUF4192 family protein [Candidatus Nanopelagicaceae bacterium]
MVGILERWWYERTYKGRNYSDVFQRHRSEARSRHLHQIVINKLHTTQNMRNTKSHASPMTTLTSPHDLLAAIPFLVGFKPEDSIVLMSIKDDSIFMALRI